MASRSYVPYYKLATALEGLCGCRPKNRPGQTASGRYNGFTYPIILYCFENQDEEAVTGLIIKYGLSGKDALQWNKCLGQTTEIVGDKSFLGYNLAVEIRVGNGCTKFMGSITIGRR